MLYTECEIDTAVTIALHLSNIEQYFYVDYDEVSKKYRYDLHDTDNTLSKGEIEFLKLQDHGQCHYRSAIVHYAQVLEETFDNLTEREQNTLTEHTCWERDTVTTIIERAGPDVTKIESTIQELIKEYAEQE